MKTKKIPHSNFYIVKIVLFATIFNLGGGLIEPGRLQSAAFAHPLETAAVNPVDPGQDAAQQLSSNGHTTCFQRNIVCKPEWIIPGNAVVLHLRFTRGSGFLVASRATYESLHECGGNPITPPLYYLTAFHNVDFDENGFLDVGECTFDLLFQYQTSWCEDPVEWDENLYAWQPRFQGTHVPLVYSPKNQYDFVLFQLDSRYLLPAGALPYFLGIDGCDAPSPHGVALGHPDAKIKKVVTHTATAAHPPVGEPPPDSGTDIHKWWLIPSWSEGTAEPGLSGGPFMRSSNLFASVMGLVNKTKELPLDCYTAETYAVDLAAFWNENLPPNSRSLSYYLDPSGMGAGFPGYAGYPLTVPFGIYEQDSLCFASTDAVEFDEGVAFYKEITQQQNVALDAPLIHYKYAPPPPGSLLRILRFVGGITAKIRGGIVDLPTLVMGVSVTDRIYAKIEACELKPIDQWEFANAHVQVKANNVISLGLQQSAADSWLRMNAATQLEFEAPSVDIFKPIMFNGVIANDAFVKLTSPLHNYEEYITFNAPTLVNQNLLAMLFMESANVNMQQMNVMFVNAGRWDIVARNRLWFKNMTLNSRNMYPEYPVDVFNFQGRYIDADDIGIDGLTMDLFLDQMNAEFANFKLSKFPQPNNKQNLTEVSSRDTLVLQGVNMDLQARITAKNNGRILVEGNKIRFSNSMISTEAGGAIKLQPWNTAQTSQYLTVMQKKMNLPDSAVATAKRRGTTDGQPMLKLAAAPAAEQAEVKVIRTPLEFQLLQNYPNPFNSTTNIRFTLPEIAEVKVAVYNMLGQIIAIIAQGTMQAGYHEATFDGFDLTSDVYIYAIEVNPLETGSKKYVQIKKMVLMK